MSNRQDVSRKTARSPVFDTALQRFRLCRLNRERRLDSGYLVFDICGSTNVKGGKLSGKSAVFPQKTCVRLWQLLTGDRHLPNLIAPTESASKVEYSHETVRPNSVINLCCGVVVDTREC